MGAPGNRGLYELDWRPVTPGDAETPAPSTVTVVGADEADDWPPPCAPPGTPRGPYAGLDALADADEVPDTLLYAVPLVAATGEGTLGGTLADAARTTATEVLALLQRWLADPAFAHARLVRRDTRRRPGRPPARGPGAGGGLGPGALRPQPRTPAGSSWPTSTAPTPPRRRCPPHWTTPRSNSPYRTAR